MEHARQYVPELSAPPPLHGGLASTVRTILVVEDNPLIRLNAVSAFEEACFEVLEAESADVALGILENRPGISLVFTDISMPGTMDGLDLLRLIRIRWPGIKLIVASGEAIIDEVQLPDDAVFFRKPYADDTIVDAARSLLMENCGPRKSDIEGV